MSITDQINKFIAENGGNERDALNIALARLEAAQKERDLYKFMLNNRLGEEDLIQAAEAMGDLTYQMNR